MTYLVKQYNMKVQDEITILNYWLPTKQPNKVQHLHTKDCWKKDQSHNGEAKDNINYITIVLVT